MTYELAIGDRIYSSWSLRGWLLFAKFGIPVRTRHAAMKTPAFRELLADFAISRTVPSMRFDGTAVWDSLAMVETLAERHPDAGFWPGDPAARAAARSITAEMHSGFGALRAACPMNLRHAYDGFAASDAVQADLARIEDLWAHAHKLAGDGPWLFGRYCVADVFYAPVATRIATYGLSVGAKAQAYVAAHLAEPCFRRWRAMGFAENHVQPGYDLDLPRVPWPGPPPLAAEPVSAGTPVNATCPFSGGPVVPGGLARIGTVTVGFCNAFCRDKMVADPAAWPEVLDLLRA